ncbi:MAG: phosphoribosylaminoimidazolesuccinocarboxamide synthase [Bdellovibrionales bacterium]|nr:phosphoribosylaminoimidazolesuccinocarboxamide synthase [Bdellovibrionales bacterium]
MKWIKGDFLHKGKGKSIYAIQNHPALVWMEFKDDLTAFNGKKTSSFKGKGALNRDMSSLIFRFLKGEEIENHWMADVNNTGMVCRKLEIIPLEVVVRNRLAGSTARKFQFSEGRPLPSPLVEFYYKQDELGDPFVSSEQALAFGFVSDGEEVEFLKTQALRVNDKLKTFFDSAGLELIDFKLEFGKEKPEEVDGSLHRENLNSKNRFLLGDEISCDSCRLWDKKTGDRMDKDRFRLNLGGIEESYKKVHDLLYRSFPAVRFYEDKLRKDKV